MLLQYYPINYNIPHTSVCRIKSEGTFEDGDMVTVTSPIFSSIDFTSNQFQLSSGFEALLRITNPVTIPSCGMDGILVCDDNDVFNMYVKIV